MKGIILAGGSGTRLAPMTRITSKQLLPIYDQPMVYFALQTFLDAGITDILVISAPDHAGDFQQLLGSGSEFGARIMYEIQDRPAGIAQALSLAESFANGESCALILGDNIFEYNFANDINVFTSGAMIFAKEVPDPARFGVVEMDADGKVLSIEEKPAQPKTNLAQTGMYVYDEHVFEYIKRLKPSDRGELEITDLNNLYLEEGKLQAKKIGGFWLDAGTVESLYQASTWRRSNILAQK